MNNIPNRILNDKSKLIIIFIIIAFTFEIPVFMYKLMFSSSCEFETFLGGYMCGVLSLSAITVLSMRKYS